MTELFQVGGSWQLGVPPVKAPASGDGAVGVSRRSRKPTLQLPGYLHPTRHGGFHHHMRKPLKSGRQSVDHVAGRRLHNSSHALSSDDEDEVLSGRTGGCRCGLDVDRLVLPLCEVETRYHSVTVASQKKESTDRTISNSTSATGGGLLAATDSSGGECNTVTKTTSYVYEAERPIPLSRCETHDLFNQLPVRYQGNQWEVAFDTSLDGHSMRHFYRVLAGEVDTQESTNRNVGAVGCRSNKRHSYHSQQALEIELLASKETMGSDNEAGGSGSYKLGSSASCGDGSFQGAGILLVVGTPKHPVNGNKNKENKTRNPSTAAGKRLTSLFTSSDPNGSPGSPGHSRNGSAFSGNSPGHSNQSFSPGQASLPHGPRAITPSGKSGVIPCKPVKQPQCVFGAFVGETPTVRHGPHHFFGGRESFAFSFAPEPKPEQEEVDEDDCASSAKSSLDSDFESSDNEDDIIDADGELSRQQRRDRQQRKEGKCRAFRWNGNKANENFMVCHHQFLGIGGGDKGAAIFINSDFQSGTTSLRCSTYDSPVLCGDPRKLKVEHLHQMEFSVQRLLWIKLEGTRFVDISPAATAKRMFIESTLRQENRLTPLSLPEESNSTTCKGTNTVAKGRREDTGRRSTAFSKWLKAPYCRKKKGHHVCDLMALMDNTTTTIENAEGGLN